MKTGGYDPRFFSIIAEVEERHFWFRARARLIEEIASATLSGLNPGYRVLEIGCGNGNVLRHLVRASRGGQVLGLDLYSEGLRFSAERSKCPVVCADIMQSPFATKFQLVGAFDVLEHIQDDLGALTAMRNSLSEDGSLLITVPADPSLWSYFDEAAHHCRRYTVAELRAKLTQAGYVVKFLTPFMAVTYPLLWLWRRMASGGKEAYGRSQDELKIIPGVNSLLGTLLAAERFLIRKHRRLPIGSSLLALAQPRR
jgi:SAM-dependent methyltransferase